MMCRTSLLNLIENLRLVGCLAIRWAFVWLESEANEVRLLKRDSAQSRVARVWSEIEKTPSSPFLLSKSHR